MNGLIRPASGCLVLFTLILGACAPTATPIPFTSTPSAMPATSTRTLTPEPTSTPTLVPTATPLPGTLVLPVETLGISIPWLPLDAGYRLSVSYVGFNTRLPPFDSATVRRAFAAAIDRGPLLEMARRYGVESAVPATTLTPPDTLGRDLYGEVGIRFDPQAAKDLLIQAGYDDPSDFPTVVFLISAYGGRPGARFNMANAMADMWATHLGVEVDIQIVQGFHEYYERLRTDPTELFWFSWAADYNDPDNFLRELFRTGSESNNGGFSNSDFDDLVDRARTTSDPAERQELYIQAERLLCETEAALIPLYHN